jgi:hypothetical protein
MWLSSRMTKVASHDLNDIEFSSDDDIDDCGHKHVDPESDEFLDSTDDTAHIGLKQINFGDISIPCPKCGNEADTVLVGMGTVENREEEEGDFNDLRTIGVICYPCRHSFYAPYLVDPVANILNAEEIGVLHPDLFDKIHVGAGDDFDGEEHDHD